MCICTRVCKVGRVMVPAGAFPAKIPWRTVCLVVLAAFGHFLFLCRLSWMFAEEISRRGTGYGCCMHAPTAVRATARAASELCPPAGPASRRLLACPRSPPVVTASGCTAAKTVHREDARLPFLHGPPCSCTRKLWLAAGVDPSSSRRGGGEVGADCKSG